MTLRDEQWRRSGSSIARTCPDEIDCEQWLDRVGTYLDLVEAGEPIPETLRCIEQHLSPAPNVQRNFRRSERCFVR